ncbi:GIY-YIG nuclease family protein [Streptomyces lavendofoliae]|uniref:Bacteriophage T5 Orf172 DNA-binding domain-containing protein n=1 Tax=Streptomyces lavendofoliae TaxID=67314 RepID=A0A918I388_9ACTN|nr:GIY-YIG nuclease family protein [Streptomyces lavendofoliae]GGU62509.1 hypothetical protein GCM10010274_59130 [Streptomyces lavendofoliae]
MIYVIGVEGSQVVKIGLGGNPQERLGQLQTGNPHELLLLWVHEGGRALESHLHATFLEYRVRGEWFDLSPLGDATQAVKDAVRAASGRLLPAPRRQRTARRPAVQPVVETREALFEGRFPAAVTFVDSPVFHGWDDRFPPAR